MKKIYKTLLTSVVSIATFLSLTTPAQASTTTPESPVASIQEKCATTPKRVVSTDEQLTEAINTVGVNGGVILIKNGTYSPLTIKNIKRTGYNPLYLCGETKTGVVFKESNESEYTPGNTQTGIAVECSSYVTLHNLSVRNSKKGLYVRSSTNVIASHTTYRLIGEEAVHFGHTTQKSGLYSSNVQYTGLATPEYGEGIYIGNHLSNWTRYPKDCAIPNNSGVDGTNNITVQNNTIKNTAAEAVDIKEGSYNNSIVNNNIEGNLSVAADRSIVIRSSNNIVKNNTIITDLPNKDGITVYAPPSNTPPPADGTRWGTGNIIEGNNITFSTAPEFDTNDLGIRATFDRKQGKANYGINFLIYPNLVGCDNTSTGATRTWNIGTTKTCGVMG